MNKQKIKRGEGGLGRSCAHLSLIKMKKKIINKKKGEERRVRFL